MRGAQDEVITTIIRIDHDVPIRATVPVQKEISVPIRTTVEIDDGFDFNLAGQRVRIPIDITVPVSTTVPIQINETVEISTTVAINVDLPVTVPMSDTIVVDYLDALYQALTDIDSELGSP
ncbi:MAG: hypothetical protein HC893_03925 [Chloroflexaceae bacterium]|nr:hypothetical protein [Chloroflexaceae bacterium]